MDKVYSFFTITHELQSSTYNIVIFLFKYDGTNQHLSSIAKTLWQYAQ